MKHKKLYTALVVFFTIIVVLAIFLMIWFWGDSYPDFKDFKAETGIPGLDEGAVPQGLGNYNADYTITDENGDERTVKQDYMFISAYMMDGSPSRIYVTGKVSGYIGYVTMKNPNGSDYTGHCGGIATNGTTLWVTSGSEVFVAKRSSDSYTNIAREVIARAQLEDGENVISFTDSFDANCNASFCFFYDDTSASNQDKLYVGEFYRKGNYETDEKHHITTDNGDKNTAFVYQYSVNNSSSYKYGLTEITDSRIATADRVPKIDRIYSITGKIQGFARTAEGIVLSQSYGLANSHLYYYDFSHIETTRKTYSSVVGENFVYSGVEIKRGEQEPNPYTENPYIYFIDSSSLIRDYSIPSMSEGLTAINGRVFVLFESGSLKYGKFVRQQIKDVYSFIPRS